MTEDVKGSADGVANETTAEYARAVKDIRTVLLRHDTRIISLILLEFAAMTHSNLMGAGLITAERIGESFDAARVKALTPPAKMPNVRQATVEELRGEAVATPSTETKQ